MKTLLATLAFALVSLPGAAYAADGGSEKCCCCDKMKHEGKDCCDEKAPSAPEGDHAGHGEHHPEAPAN